jgi:DNA methylase
MMVSGSEGHGLRTVHHQEALSWLNERRDFSGCSFVTSLPDFSEFKNMDFTAWKLWFVKAASLVLSRCPPQGVVVFFQTDIKHNGVWIDKGYLCQKAAEEVGHVQLWHKIACRFAPGRASFGRPAYSHILCFSQDLRGRDRVGEGIPDVLPQTGDVTWTRGMGVDACRAACEFILSSTDSHTVVDPFCGHGTVLAVANSLGLNGIGVELVARRVQKARALKMSGRHLIS